MTKLWWNAVRFGFRLLYNEMAWTYDLVSWVVSLGEWRAWQRAALKHIRNPLGQPILELAHGTANLQIDLRTLGYQSVAIDLSPYMGQIARRKLLRNRIEPRLVRARAETLPFADAAFSTIIATFPTNFIFDPRTLAEAFRLLNAGGRLIVVPNGMLAGKTQLARLVERGIDLAYLATGQNAEAMAAIRARFEQAGFIFRVVQEPCDRSVAVVIVAEKPPLPQWTV